ncbi:MAG: anthranilate synthase component I family protein [Bacteroidota bacterium]
MKTYKLTTQHRKLLADTLTPVSIYIKLRDKFANSILLESSDYHGNENSFSYICCDPIASFKVEGKTISTKYPGEEAEVKEMASPEEGLEGLRQFSSSFDHDAQDFKFITNGIFGYIGYDAVRYFEDINLDSKSSGIPDMLYHVYRYVIAIDHFKNELFVFEHNPEGSEAQGLDQIITTIRSRNFPAYNFHVTNGETSNFTDEEFLELIQKGKDHCSRGDVFQIVLSRRFETGFEGDEFNVYRALRSINPSPYLFYFDYGTFKIFGSSPEAQIVIKNDQATIYPIAGTFRRTGNDLADAELAKKLADDEKENSEHVMLVDLARNDLSRNSEEVNVEVFKEVQFYSHVIHLVSKVTGKLADHVSPLRLVADTFPAGTLSGAPKHMAMQLIDRYENLSREHYAGAIGFLGFNGDFNHAIMIRTFMSRENQLIYQAGAGIVAKSNVESELQEVHNKLEALRKAMTMAEEIE